MDGMVRDMRSALREVGEHLKKEEQELQGTSQAKLVCLGPMVGINLINLRVQRQNGKDIFYRMGKNLPLEHLMNDYCRRKGLALDTVRFLFDGEKLSKKYTAEKMKMEDDDIIDAFSEQFGEHLKKEEQELQGTSQAKLVCLGPMVGVNLANLINLRVQRQNEEDIFYRLGKNLPLEHLMNDYCRRKDLALDTVRFLFDGKKVSKKYTAEKMKMEDDDIIDAFSEQFGG